MKGVRIAFGVLLLLGAGFIAGFAAIEAGAQHGWGEFRGNELFGKALLMTLGAGTATLVGILTARVGKWSLGPLLGVPVAIGGVLLGMNATVILNHHPGGAILWAAASSICAVFAAVILARR